MTRLGVVFLPQSAPERLRAVAVAADESGLEELWLWEDCFSQGGISSVAAALAWTEKLRVGIGVLPVPLRNVAVAAMEIANLDRLFPGRAQVAVGHGVQEWMQQVGARAASPLTLTRDYLGALNRLLAGETVDLQGGYVQLEDVGLDWPPAQRPAVFGSAVGPRSMRLCGELADGTVLTGGTTPDGVRAARTLINQGRAAAGRSDHHHIVVYVIAASGASSRDRLNTELRRWSLDPTADVGVAGDASTVAAAVQRWADAGADSVIMQPTVDDPDPEAFIRFIATEVRPLVT